LKFFFENFNLNSSEVDFFTVSSRALLPFSDFSHDPTFPHSKNFPVKIILISIASIIIILGKETYFVGKYLHKLVGMECSRRNP
jgi:hypothetical protein